MGTCLVLVGRSSVVYQAIFGALVLGLSVGCGSANPTSPPDDDATRLTPTEISGPFTLVDASVVEQPGSPPVLSYSVRIANQGSSAIRVDYTGCATFLRLYTRAERTGQPVYDSGPPGVACTVPLHTVTIAAGAIGSVTAQVLLDPSLASGHYFASVAISPNGSPTVLSAGEVDIAR